MDYKGSSFPSLTGIKNINWETVDVCMSVTEEDIRKATGGFNSPVELWGITNSPRDHVDRFHPYRICPNKRDLDVFEQENKSIQEYTQHTSMMGGSRGDQDSPGQSCHKSSMSVRYMFAERKIQFTQSWK